MARQTLLYLVINQVAAINLITAEYRTGNCGGQPEAIYGQTIPDSYNYTQIGSVTLSTFTQYLYATYTMADCGNAGNQATGNCCTTVLTKDASPYYSGFAYPYQGNFQDNIPASANNLNFCQLYAADNSSLLGYNSAYLAPNGNCIDGIFTCSSAGLSVYSSLNCQGTPEVISLTPTTSNYTSVALGNIYGQFGPLNGNMSFIWQTYVPPVAIVPYFNRPSDFVALICFILSIGLAVYLPVNYIIELKGKNISIWAILTFAGQLCWLVWIVLEVCYWCIIFNDNQQLAIFDEFTAISLGLATLMSTIVSSAVLFIVFPEKWLKIVVPAVLISLHLALFGGKYSSSYLFSGGSSPIVLNANSYVALQNWNSLNVYWILVVLIWNCTIPIFVAFKILAMHSKSSTYWKTLVKMHKVDPRLIWFIVIQFIIFASYYTISYLRYNTNVVYSDLDYNNTSAYLWLCLITHAVLCDRVSNVLKTVSQNKYSSQNSMMSGNGSSTLNDASEVGSANHLAPKGDKNSMLYF
ncbi:hypothetical protein HK103_001770 [Boothiomyces macroporosus]|uniref:Uncharacterized protein n=1 Tax=Boothiomyces macroporosus TaxID=261099 RepID=A0AAD5Y0F3_9FUNG|nr:hypothetical protein HK103_001770 [Boothiomyces macroporosus]